MSDVVLRDKDFEYSLVEDLAKISPLSTAAGQSTCNHVLQLNIMPSLTLIDFMSVLKREDTF